jgi:hypothetical protein
LKNIPLIDIQDINLEENIDKNNKNKNIYLSTNVLEAKKLVKLLSYKRANDYNLWIQVIWCLHNIDEINLFEDAIEFSKKCNNKFDYAGCKKVWDQIYYCIFLKIQLHLQTNLFHLYCVNTI